MITDLSEKVAVGPAVPPLVSFSKVVCGNLWLPASDLQGPHVTSCHQITPYRSQHQLRHLQMDTSVPTSRAQ